VIPRVNDGCKTLPLRVFADLIMGQAPVGDSYNDEGHGLPLIAGAGDLGQVTPEPKKWTDAPTKVGQQGDIIVCVRATIGDLNWADRPYCYGRGVAAVRVKSGWEPHFIWYWLEACKAHLQGLGRGATFKQISKEDLAELPTPELPLREQRRIVSRIKACIERVEEIKRLRKSAEREREYLAESLIEAELAELPGHEVAMSDVCEIASRLVDPREREFQAMLHVGGANIESRTGRLVDLKTASEEGLKSGKFVFDASVVLYNKIRPYLIKVARPDFSGLCSADMYPLTPRADLASRDFIYYVLMSRRFTAYSIGGSNRAGMPKVNREHLFAYRFTLPPLETQRRVCETLDSAIESVQRLGREMSDAASEIDLVRGSILHKAFAGDL
jgi:type I restriction enzyme S subunit